MKLVQKYPLNWLGEYTFELNDPELIQTYKSIWGSSQRKFLIKDIAPLVGQNISGNRAWENIGWFFFFLGWFLSMLSHSLQVFFICFALGGACFLIRYFVRDTFVVFEGKSTNAALFWIRLSDDKAGEFIEELKRKISNN